MIIDLPHDRKTIHNHCTIFENILIASHRSRWHILTCLYWYWFCFEFGQNRSQKRFNNVHSVESPSMVHPQWNIWYWGSKWNLRKVCWDAVGCEWGTTSVYFGITYVCLISSRLLFVAVEHQYRHFLFMFKISFEGHKQNLQKCHVGLKFEWGL